MRFWVSGKDNLPLVAHRRIRDIQRLIQDLKSFRQLILIDDQWRIYQDHIPMDERIKAVIQQVSLPKIQS